MKTNNGNILSANNITLKYKSRTGIFKSFEHTVLDNISFNLIKGEILGLIGQNGCGKSTLLRILADIIKPTSGNILCNSTTRRALLSLGLGFRPDLSGKDNALLSTMLQGATKTQATELLQNIREFSELGAYFEQPVKTYSSGMRARLGFATAIVTQVEILLIDEVLSVGDMHFRHKAEKAMQEKLNNHQTVVFVSHNAQQVKQLCSRAIWLKNGLIHAEGDTENVTKQYREFIQIQNGNIGTQI